MTAFAALLLAHVLAESLRPALPRGLARPAHLLMVIAATALLTGQPRTALALTALHLAICLARPLFGTGLRATFTGQALHVASLVIAALSPETPLYAPPAPGLMALAAGALIATRGGGVVLAQLMRPFAAAAGEGLPRGGRMIGLLERGLVFLLVLGGMPEGIGFLIAAKSVLRFGAAQDDRGASEYIIIGTLASFGWALATALATLALLAHLPPLGIPDLSP